MSLTSTLGIAAAVSGVLMALSPLLQVRRIRIAGNSSEVSAGVFLMMRTNATIWISYGLVSANLVLIVPNAVGLLTTSATLAMIRRYRSPEPVAAPEPVATPAPLVRRHAARVRGGAATVARAALARR